jgi:hypothetical protein
MSLLIREKNLAHQSLIRALVPPRAMSVVGSDLFRIQHHSELVTLHFKQESELPDLPSH